MKQVLLDTNFILTCVRQKIDFFEDIRFFGLEILIPKQVINEVGSVINSKKKFHFREDAKLALKLLEKNSFKEIDLEKKKVDSGIINFLEKNKDIILATLDSELKRKVKNPKLVIREKKKLEVI